MIYREREQTESKKSRQNFQGLKIYEEIWNFFFFFLQKWQCGAAISFCFCVFIFFPIWYFKVIFLFYFFMLFYSFCWFFYSCELGLTIITEITSLATTINLEILPQSFCCWASQILSLDWMEISDVEGWCSEFNCMQRERVSNLLNIVWFFQGKLFFMTPASAPCEHYEWKRMDWEVKKITRLLQSALVFTVADNKKTFSHFCVILKQMKKLGVCGGK